MLPPIAIICKCLLSKVLLSAPGSSLPSDCNLLASSSWGLKESTQERKKDMVMVERWNGKERKGGKEKMNLFMTLTKIGTYSWVLNFYGELMGERVRKHPSIPKNRTKGIGKLSVARRVVYLFPSLHNLIISAS